MRMNGNGTYKYPVQKIPEIKLLILYIAEQAKTVCKAEKVSRLWLSDFAMENIATDYFKFQCAVGELVAEGYLENDDLGSEEFLSVTDKGSETVGFFFTELPISVRETVDKNLTASLLEKKKKDAAYAEYLKLGEKVHMASLRLYDGETPLMHLELTMPERDSAVALSRAMRKHPEILYKKIMETAAELLEDSETE